MLKHNISN